MVKTINPDSNPDSNSDDTPEYWSRKLYAFYDYISQNPSATVKSVKDSKFRDVFYKFYKGSINEAKEDVGVDDEFLHRGHTGFSKRVWDERREFLFQYFRENPKVKFLDMPKNYRAILSGLYGHKFNVAKRDAGIDEKFLSKSGINEPFSDAVWDERKSQLFDYLRTSPKVSRKVLERTPILGPTLNHFYGCNINSAKRDAGVDDKFLNRGFPDKISADEWQQRLLALNDFLVANPHIKKFDVKGNVYVSTINHFHNGSLGRAKTAAGVVITPREKITQNESRRLSYDDFIEKYNSINEFLLEDPRATKEDVFENNLMPSLNLCYHGLINSAKFALGLSKDSVGRKLTKKRGFSYDDWKERFDSINEFLLENPSATRKDVIANGLMSSLGLCYDGRINRAKLALGLFEDSAGKKHRTNRMYSYDEFIESYHSVIEFLLENPSASISDLKKSRLHNDIDVVYGSSINNAKISLGLIKNIHHPGGKNLSETVWEERRQKLLLFLKNHPHASRKEMLENHDCSLAIHQRYKGFIVPALIDAGFNDVGITSFLETYHLDAAKYCAKKFIEYRESLGLLSPLLNDLVQEASIGIVKAARARPRMSRMLALMAAKFKLRSYFSHVDYPNSAVKLKLETRKNKESESGELLDIVTPKMLDAAIITGVAQNDKVVKALATLNPISLEYQILLDDSDEDGLNEDYLGDIDDFNDFDSSDSRAAAFESNEKLSFDTNKYSFFDKLSDISSDDIANALDKTSLKFKEKKVLNALYLSGEKLTLEEVSKIFNVTRERVRQIESKAIKKLQIPQNRIIFSRYLGLELSDEDEELLAAERTAKLLIKTRQRITLLGIKKKEKDLARFNKKQSELERERIVISKAKQELSDKVLDGSPYELLVKGGFE